MCLIYSKPLLRAHTKQLRLYDLDHQPSTYHHNDPLYVPRPSPWQLCDIPNAYHPVKIDLCANKTTYTKWIILGKQPLDLYTARKIM